LAERIPDLSPSVLNSIITFKVVLLYQLLQPCYEHRVDIGKDPATGRRRHHFETIRGNKGAAQKRMVELMVEIEKDGYLYCGFGCEREWQNKLATTVETGKLMDLALTCLSVEG
jgi:hypothetical protein